MWGGLSSSSPRLSPAASSSCPRERKAGWPQGSPRLACWALLWWHCPCSPESLCPSPSLPGSLATSRSLSLSSVKWDQNAFTSVPGWPGPRQCVVRLPCCGFSARAHLPFLARVFLGATASLYLSSALWQASGLGTLLLDTSFHPQLPENASPGAGRSGRGRRQGWSSHPEPARRWGWSCPGAWPMERWDEARLGICSWRPVHLSGPQFPLGPCRGRDEVSKALGSRPGHSRTRARGGLRRAREG